MDKPTYLRKAGAASVDPDAFNDLVDVIAGLSGLPVGGPTSLTDLTDVSGEPGPNKSPVGDQTGSLFTLTEVPTQEDLDAILAGVAHVDWQEPELQSNFSNLGGSWAPCQFRHTLNNTVYIQGVLTCADPLFGENAPVPIFYLPDDALPSGDLRFVVASGPSPSGPTISVVDVLADGTVAWAGYEIIGEGAEGLVSLCGISFSVGAAT